MKYLDFIKKSEENKSGFIAPYIIAEAGVNHEGSMDLAKRLVEEAAEGGADAIKFQTYKASTLAAKHSPSYWDRSKEPTASQFELFQKYDSFWKGEYEKLKRICDDNDIEFMSTPFDVESANFLNDLMEVFKISSSDLTNTPFIEYMCGFNKPILLSTGASNWDEIFKAVMAIEKHGNHLTLLQCILNYPTPDANANLGMLLDIKEKMPQHLLGYSDHTLPKDMRALEVATLLGARVLEKHFTHDKTLPGNDHYHAMDKTDLKLFIENISRDITLIGATKKVALADEAPARKNARRSLVADADLKVGEVITREHLTWKRPAFGVSPEFIDEVIGKSATMDISKDDILYWNMFK